METVNARQQLPTAFHPTGDNPLWGVVTILFDLHALDKGEEYKLWVRRISNVASILEYDYFKLWEIPEHEFKLLEEIANEMRENREKKLKEMRENHRQ